MNKLKTEIASEFWKQHGDQTRLSKEAGVNRRTIYAFLYQDVGVNVKTMLKICDALGLEVTIRKGYRGEKNE